MKEIESKIIEYIKNNWNTTYIDWGLQRQEPTADSWITIHFISEIREASRKTDNLYNVILSVGVFSILENIYACTDIIDSFRSLLEHVCLDSSNYHIELREAEVRKLPNETSTKNRTIKHSNIDFKIHVEKRR